MTANARWGVLAVLAVTACQGGGETITVHTPFLVNGTAAEETFTVTWVLRILLPAGTCPSATSLLETLNPADLDDPRTVFLMSSQGTALSYPPLLDVSPVQSCTATQMLDPRNLCVAALVEAPSTGPVLMVAPSSWADSAPPSLHCELPTTPATNAGAALLALETVGGQRRFVAGKLISIAPVDLTAIAARTPSRDGCQTLREKFRAAAAASMTCASDGECTRWPNSGISGDEVCPYVATKGTTELDALERQWNLLCQAQSVTCRLSPAPVCRNGTCGPQ